MTRRVILAAEGGIALDAKSRRFGEGSRRGAALGARRDCADGLGWGLGP